MSGGKEAERTVVGALAEELALARAADRVEGGRDEARHCRGVFVCERGESEERGEERRGGQTASPPGRFHAGRPSLRTGPGARLPASVSNQSRSGPLAEPRLGSVAYTVGCLRKPCTLNSPVRPWVRATDLFEVRASTCRGSTSASRLCSLGHALALARRQQGTHDDVATSRCPRDLAGERDMGPGERRVRPEFRSRSGAAKRLEVATTGGLRDTSAEPSTVRAQERGVSARRREREREGNGGEADAPALAHSRTKRPSA